MKRFNKKRYSKNSKEGETNGKALLTPKRTHKTY